MNKGVKVMKSAQKLAIQEVLRQMQAQSGQIQNYNFRHFFLRKTNEKMAALEEVQVGDGNSTTGQNLDVGDELLQKYQQEAEQLQRIVVVQNLYCGHGSVKPNIIEQRLKEQRQGE